MLINKYYIPLLSALLLAFCCGLPALSHAQHYQIRTYTEWEGMPTNPVFDATQDSTGLMWFSTRVGLTTYDGQNWQVHDIHPNASPQVHAKLVTDSRGTIWSVTSQDPIRISKLVDGAWITPTFFDPDFRNYITVGLDVFNQNDETTFVAVTTYLGQIVIWDGIQWHFHDAAQQLGIVRATELIGSRLYLATDNGLFAREIHQLEAPFELVPGFPVGPITHLAEIPGTNSMWVVSNQWVAQWDGKSISFKATDLKLLPIKDLLGTIALADGDKGLFFGDNGSIQYFHQDSGLEILTIFNGLVADGASAFFRDHENNIWIPSLRGVSKIVSRRFAGYNREHGLLEDEVSALLQLRDGRLVMGHPGGLTFTGDTYEPFRFKETARSLARVMDIFEDDDSSLWIAADRRGLARLSVEKEITWYTNENGLGTGVYSIFKDQNNTIWVGTSDGLFYKKGERFNNFVLPSTLSGNPPLVRKIVKGPKGTFYIATPHLGILQYDDGHIKIYHPAADRSGINTYTCFVKSDNSLLIGSSDGLFTLDGDRMRRTATPDPVIDRPIYSIMEDRQGNLWFGTDLGVFLWDGQQMTNLSKRHGMLGNETNRNAVIQTESGSIWIGTDSGASKYFPNFDTPATSFPRLQITDILIDGQSNPKGEDLVLPGPAHILEFQYRGISFLDENRIRYRTRLINFEDNWHETEILGAGARSYINVPSGKYQFQVQAIRSDGVGSPLVSSTRIIVKPTLLERWYIRFILVLVTVLLVWIVFAFLAGRRYAHRLEKEVYQHTRELRLSEKSIKSESMRLAATLKNISDGVLAVDYHGFVVLASAHACEILGLSQGEIVGQPIAEILPIDSDGNFGSHLRVPHPKSSNRFLEVSSSRINSPDESGSNADQGQVFAFRDVTDRLHQEEDRIRTQKLESLGVFAGGLAHDFNNLLTVMLGNLSVLEASPQIPDSEMQMVALVREATTRAQSLTRQLLTFALGGEPLLETDSISRIVRQSVEFALSGTNVSCKMDFPDNLRPVLVDPGQMDQVFANLVLNAVQAMPQGGNISVTARNIGSEDSPMVLVQVKDEGVGIEYEDMPRLFDPYFTTKDLGSGLGLAIVYSIITRHGGHITVDTELGVGSVFRVYLKTEGNARR